MQHQSAQAATATICLPFVSTNQAKIALDGRRAPPSVRSADIQIPHYLLTHYWWAYVHPTAVKVFERRWLVNLILWGNYDRLCRAALAEMAQFRGGRSLQVACVYGDLTTRLLQGIAEAGGWLDVIDVLSIQLCNLRAKLPKTAPVRLLAMDATYLTIPDGSYDQALVFFLLHEQPNHYRERTMRELLRVVKPGGKIVIVDYALPRVWNPLRYI
jgi:ubiquinone/menaquinone biosynthesis C-methylase UbiE